MIGLEMLKHFEKETGKEIHQLFDFIVGVSTGSLIASFLGFHKKSIDEVLETYKELGTQIFTQSQLGGVKGWVSNLSYYDTQLYEGTWAMSSLHFMSFIFKEKITVGCLHFFIRGSKLL